MGTYLGKHPLGVVVPMAYRYLEKKEAEGIDSVSVDDSIKAPIFDLKIGGNSSQQTYTGKNLFDISKAENGTIYTQTGLDLEQIDRCRPTFMYLTKGQYCFSCLNNIQLGGYIHKYSTADQTSWIGAITTSTVSFQGTKSIRTFTLDQDCYIRFVLLPKTNSGVSLDLEFLKTCQPQLEKGSTATSYEPYVGGTASPNPDYPQEIESVGDKTKNLVDVNSSTNTFGYLTKTGEVVNHTSIKYTDYISIPNNAIKLTISGMGGAVFSAPATCFYDENKNFIVGEFFNESATRTITIPSGAKYFRTCFRTTHTKFMAEYNPTATDYEPYGYKIPIKAQGKNLFGNYEIIENQYINASGNILEIQGINTYRYIPVESSTTYTISGKSASKGYIRVAEYDENKTFIKRVYNSVMLNPKITITTTSTTKYLALCPDVNFTDGTVTNSHIYDIQIEKGSIATDYESYVEPKTTHIYLKEPLRKIGAYADILDYKNKKVVRKIASDFIEKVEFLSGDANTYKKFLSDISRKPYVINSSSSYLGYAISDKFKQSTKVYSAMGSYPNLIQTYITTNGGNRCVYTFDDSSVTTLAQAQRLIGNGFEVCYVVSSAFEEPIESYEISTLEGTTNLEIKTETKPSYITLIYGIDAY